MSTSSEHTPVDTSVTSNVSNIIKELGSDIPEEAKEKLQKSIEEVVATQLKAHLKAKKESSNGWRLDYVQRLSPENRMSRHTIAMATPLFQMAFRSIKMYFWMKIKKNPRQDPVSSAIMTRMKFTEEQKEKYADHMRYALCGSIQCSRNNSVRNIKTKLKLIDKKTNGKLSIEI